MFTFTAAQWRRVTIIQSARGIPDSTSRRAFDTPRCLRTRSRISCESADCLLLHIFLLHTFLHTRSTHGSSWSASFLCVLRWPSIRPSPCLLMSLRCCLCSPSALEPRTLALPFSPPSSPFLIWLRLCFSLAPTWRHVHIVTQGFAGGSLAQGPPGHQAGSLGCVPAGADIRQLLSAAWPLLHARLLIPLRILIPRRISNLRL